MAERLDRETIDAKIRDGIERLRERETSRSPASADLGQHLTRVERFIRRFVVLSSDQALAMTLWVAHTHVIDAFDCTPYIQVSSATPRAGKTRLLEACEPLVASPWLTGRVSAAALVRKVDKEKPTLLLDESDAAFKGEKDYTETLRGILNTGYSSSGKTTLCVGTSPNFSTRDYSTFGAKCIAGIGTLPATIADRSICIALSRKRQDEPVERFRRRDAHTQAEPIHAALVAWADAAVVGSLHAARPDLPDALNDRAQDVCEPLLAIADMAGGDWPGRARRAAVALIGDDRSDEDNGLELLWDINVVFDDKNTPFISTKELVAELCGMEDRPWATWAKGKGINGHRVARMLNPFGVEPKPNDQGKARGYYRDRFEDAWSRYPRFKASNRQATNENGPEPSSSKRQDTPLSDTLEPASRPMNTGLLDALTLQQPNDEEWKDAGNGNY